MKQQNQKLCSKCHKRPAQAYDDLCKCCAYQRSISYELDRDADDRDWSFTVCEECGSSLDSCGECRNTSCGASPYQGTDWI